MLGVEVNHRQRLHPRLADFDRGGEESVEDRVVGGIEEVFWKDGCVAAMVVFGRRREDCIEGAFAGIGVGWDGLI